MSRGVRNLWKVDLDPQDGRWIGGPHRLTTGAGIDGAIAVSHDGTRLAFVTMTRTNRLWGQPFDATIGQGTGEAQPMTAANLSVLSFDLSADGKRLVYAATRPGKEQMELWSHSLEDRRADLLGEARHYFAPRLSRDGTRVAYRTVGPEEPLARRLFWAALDGGKEHAMPQGLANPSDWSRDGQRILHNCPPPERYATLCVSPRDASDVAQTRPVLADPDHAIWQGRFSPDDRWVLFNAQSLKQSGISVIGVVSTAGGAWRPLTDSALWADKPRWAPDGRTLYFISNRLGGFFDVWARRFDPEHGTPAGEEFRVTSFENPGRTLEGSAAAELGVSSTRLVVPITETSGSVWVLDNVKH